MAELVDPRTVERVLVAGVGVVMLVVVCLLAIVNDDDGQGWIAQVVDKGDTYVCVEARNGGGPAEHQSACFNRHDEGVETGWDELRLGACVDMIERGGRGIAIEEVDEDYPDCSAPDR